MDLSPRTKRKVMGLGRQAEDKMKWEKKSSVQKSGASCNVETFKQSNSFSVKAPSHHMYFKLVLKQNKKLRQPPKACSYDNSQNEIRLFNCVQTLRCHEVIIVNLSKRRKMAFDNNLQISRLYVLSLHNYIYFCNCTSLVIFSGIYLVKQKITSALESEAQAQ